MIPVQLIVLCVVLEQELRDQEFALARREQLSRTLGPPDWTNTYISSLFP